jgi:hypothetical protein
MLNAVHTLKGMFSTLPKLLAFMGLPVVLQPTHVAAPAVAAIVAEGDAGPAEQADL